MSTIHTEFSSTRFLIALFLYWCSPFCWFTIPTHKSCNIKWLRSSIINRRKSIPQISRRVLCRDVLWIQCISCDICYTSSKCASHHKSAYSSSNITHSALITGKCLRNIHLSFFLPGISLNNTRSTCFLSLFNSIKVFIRNCN